MGIIQANFEHLWISFEKDGRCFELKGEPESTLKQVSIKTLSKETINDGEFFLVQMKDLVEGKQIEEEEIVAAYMAELKMEYKTVYVDELELPPSRECNHAIRLQPGATLPNIHPYRYPMCKRMRLKN